MARDWTIGPRARGALRYLAALGMVAVSTAVAEVIYRVFHTDRLSRVFLAGVLVAAVTLGPGPADRQLGPPGRRTRQHPPDRRHEPVGQGHERALAARAVPGGLVEVEHLVGVETDVGVGAQQVV